MSSSQDQAPKHTELAPKQPASESFDPDQKLREAMAEQYGCMSDSFRRFSGGFKK